MEEIKVGEYVRTVDGNIQKIDRIIEGATNMYFVKNGFYYKANILKHSFDTIDLIEAGDYVNGEKITRIIPPDICGDEVLENARIFTETKEIYESDIKSVVTKEQFENIKYRVEEK